ncbi:hypothetical protein H6F61_05340 [Cyanobacteria bacterium FACHB-472]|nr:hypothetical protein [Cyanobacteria bacterium FACHB-472]
METSVVSVLGLVTFALLFIVSGGVVYLTLAEWRDRRRQEKEKRENKLPLTGRRQEKEKRAEKPRDRRQEKEKRVEKVRDRRR